MQIERFLGGIPLKKAEGPFPDALHRLAHIRHPHAGDSVAWADLPQMIDRLDAGEFSRNAPLYISYYTANTPYEALADSLRRSLDRLGLEHRIEAIPSLGSWVANTGLKSAFIERVWQESDRPICWVDADADVLRRPDFLNDNPFDISLVCRHGWYFISSFVYLNKTPAAGLIVKRWAELARENPHVWDQVLLTLAWYEVARGEPVSSLFLPDGVFRFPRPWLRDLRDKLIYHPLKRKMRPFIDQKQASRSLKSFVDGSKKRENELGSDDVSPHFREALTRHDFRRVYPVEQIFA
ncbi:hypothetical protein [Rhizobium paknamense]|uniref:Nucleotide-diphospho-sugar transferase n=1 Tax=Rhizobium paknamense TaxID=1206817 RepID=A0ABU0I8I3_9HYPH|nr:hypothetical protein [Rhizobium paknamense]MDQ0454546.1 hypothetical protein [Rhizobium paknamense]